MQPPDWTHSTSSRRVFDVDDGPKFLEVAHHGGKRRSRFCKQKRRREDTSTVGALQAMDQGRARSVKEVVDVADQFLHPLNIYFPLYATVDIKERQVLHSPCLLAVERVVRHW